MNTNNWNNESVPADLSGTNSLESGIRNESVLDQTKRVVADKLRNVSDQLHQQSSRNDINRELGNYGQQAAQWLDRSADYVNDMNPQKIKDDVKNQVKANPGRTLLIAGGIGLLLGAVLRRR